VAFSLLPAVFSFLPALAVSVAVLAVVRQALPPVPVYALADAPLPAEFVAAKQVRSDWVPGDCSVARQVSRVLDGCSVVEVLGVPGLLRDDSPRDADLVEPPDDWVEPGPGVPPAEPEQADWQAELALAYLLGAPGPAYSVQATDGHLRQVDLPGDLQVLVLQVV
jgi:hypothetical protein